MKKIFIITPIMIMITPLSFFAAEAEKSVNTSFIFSEFFLQILATIILIIILKKFTWKNFQEVLERRKKEINSNIDNAQQSMENAQKIEQEKVQEINEIKANKLEIMKVAKDKAKAEEDRIVGEAKEESRMLLEKAQAEALQEKENIKSELSSELGAASVELLKKFLSDEVDEDMEKRLAAQAVMKVSNE